MMKKLMQKTNFLIRLAHKNIIYTKFRTIILFITFIILFFLSIIAFSTKPFLNDYYYHFYFNKYKNIDLYLTYDENSNVRFFSIRELINNLNVEEDFNFIAPFFETTSLIELNDDYFYAKIMASDIENFKKINHKVPQYISNIKANEIIITSTISDKYKINKKDFINMYVGNELVKFKIIEVIEDDGLLYGETVFINKDSYISNFLKTAGGYGLTKNIYNVVYFDIKDENQIPVLKKEIQSIPYYRDLHLTIKETIDHKIVQDSVNKFGSLFYLAYIFIILAVILVLQSTLTLIFEERKTQVGIIKILGGNNNFAYTSILIEFLIYSIPAFIISYLLSNIVVNNGLRYINSTFRYKIPILNTIYGLIFVLIGIIIITTYNYLKILKTSHIKLSITKRTKYKDISYLYLIIFIISIILLIFINYLKLNLEVKALIKIILAFIIIFTTTKLLLTVFKHILKYRKQKNLFTLLSPNLLSDNKIIKQIINVLVISFIIIIFLTGIRDYSIKRGNIIKENIYRLFVK